MTLTERLDEEIIRATADYEPSGYVDLIAELREQAAEIEAAARALIMATTPFITALELDGYKDTDGEQLHDRLRKALGISFEEWRESPDR